MPKLLRDLKSFYKTQAREHLPWRQTHDPYRIMVSEIMLQQTQVERVIPFYERFIK
jgi:A/G-specific adenine glycosylase